MKINHQWLWALPVAWGLLIIYLSLLPGGAGMLTMFGIPHFDKIAHMGAYGLWALLWVLAASGGNTRSKKATTIIVFACVVMGCALEFVQYFMHQGRSFEVLDMVANGVGVILGVWASGWILPFLKRNRNIQLP